MVIEEAFRDGPATRKSTRPPTVISTVERALDRAPGTRSLWLRLPPSRKLTYKPGQFISCELPLGETPTVRPYTIASSSDGGNLIEICLDLVPGGVGSHHLFSLGIGGSVSFTGPWGLFTLDHPPLAECVFVASGTGVVPLRAMIRRVLDSGDESSLVLLYGERDERRLLYRDEFETWAREQARFAFVPILSEPPAAWRGARGDLLAAAEERYVKADSDRRRHFYICGVGDIVTRLRDLLRGAGYERRAIHYEKW